MDEKDHTRAPLTFDLRDEALPRGLQKALLQHRLECRKEEEQPDEIAGGHHDTLQCWGETEALMPAAKPPACAHQATPPTSPGCARNSVPLNTWLSAQKPR